MFPYPVNSRLKYYNLILFLLLGGGSAFGQLNADFIMDKTGGCSPVVVNFTSTTTGASSNAVYKWDFGNGNTSALIQAAAVYTEEQTYTVTLTVQDGSNQSSRTRQVTVYRPPTVDFSVDNPKICLGSASIFTANASAGDGSISSYAWDFGDGSTVQNSFNIQSYTYSTQQQATVSLTVTNTYGCHTTLKKQNIITIIPPLTASFSADKRVLCLVTDAVQFTNASSGPGALDYLWDFADGTNSTALNPNHIFNKKGNYSVSLKVHSSEGCIAMATQTNPLNVANYSTAFSLPSPICIGSYVTFTGQSSPVPDNSVWQVDGVTQGFYYGSFSYPFNTLGTHTVTLNNIFGTCPQTSSQQVSVKGLPVPGVFTENIAGVCGSPVAVNFKDQTPGAVAWQWNFNAYGFYNGGYVQGTSNVQAPTFTYPTDGTYEISLQVTNADGCSATTYQSVSIVTPSVGLTEGNPIISACTSLLTNTFTPVTIETLKTTKWNFGDGGTSTDPNPTHSFKNTGQYYLVTLNYTTVNGCSGSVSIYQYTSPSTPVRVFVTPDNLYTCLTPITANYTYATQDPLTTTNWTFGDGATSSLPSPSHTYSSPGGYVATLSYVTQDGCKGTVTSDAVTIDPRVKISFAENPNPVCGNSVVSFSAASSTPDNNVLDWTFGDGGSNYGNMFNPTYQYNVSGSYTVTLYVRNQGGCDTTLSQPITINPPFPRFVGHTNTCDGTRGTVTFTQASVQATTVTWNFGDGATATTPATQTTITHTYTKTGVYTATLTAVNGSCSLLANDPGGQVYVLLKQSPLLAGNVTSVCTNGSVTVQLSRLEANPYQTNNPGSFYYYAGYSLPFGTPAIEYRDGTVYPGYPVTPVDPLNPYNPYHWTTVYNGTLTNFQAGEKDIRFILQSAGFGCMDTTNYMPLLIKGAIGGFEIQSDHLCYQSPVILKDTSSTTGNNPILSWQWSFGDGQTLTKKSGGTLTHLYANPGSYQVSMQFTDAAGCSPGTPYLQTVTVNGPKASFYTSGTDVHLNTTVVFYNTTNDYGNTNTVYTWNFGDGSTSTDPYPVHTYPVPGTYTVTMTAANPSVSCSSTATPVTIIVRNFNSAFGFSSS